MEPLNSANQGGPNNDKHVLDWGDQREHAEPMYTQPRLHRVKHVLKEMSYKMRVFILVPWPFQRHFRASVTFDGAEPGSESHAAVLSAASFTTTSRKVFLFLLHQDIFAVRMFSTVEPF